MNLTVGRESAARWQSTPKITRKKKRVRLRDPMMMITTLVLETMMMMMMMLVINGYGLWGNWEEFFRFSEVITETALQTLLQMSWGLRGWITFGL